MEGSQAEGHGKQQEDPKWMMGNKETLRGTHYYVCSKYLVICAHLDHLR